MRINKAKVNNKLKPFYKDDIIELYCIANEQNKFIEFKCVYKGKETSFPVIDNNILAAWRNMEKFLLTKK